MGQWVAFVGRCPHLFAAPLRVRTRRRGRRIVALPLLWKARSPAHARAPVSAIGACRWCARACRWACPACSPGVYFGNECQQWLLGCDQSFAPESPDHWWLCPDCMAAFVPALRTSSSRPRSMGDNREVSAHMDRVAAACLPGAGALVARRPGLWRCWVVRQFVLRTLQGRAWTPINQLLRLYCEWQRPRLGRLAPDRAASLLALSNATRALERERLIWVAPGQTSVRLRGVEGTAPHMAVHQHRRRRRATSSRRGESPVPQRRRQS